VFKYEQPKQERVEDDDDDEDKDDYVEDDNFVKDETYAYSRENARHCSFYMMPYVYKRHFLDTEYGVRKVGDMFMIGDSPIVVGTGGHIKINERVFKGSKGMWELLTRKKVNTEFITNDDLKTYKKILTMTKAHLTKYKPHGNINITRGKHFGISLRPSLRNRRDAVSNPRYDVSGQSINGYQ